MKITAFAAGVGYPSNTTQLAEAIGSRLGAATGAEVEQVELRDVGSSIGEATMLGVPRTDLKQALSTVENTDVLIAATPTFRGSYAGLFKAFFDLVDASALQNKPVVLAATGGSARHQQVIDLGLRPLFSFFGSLIVPTAIFATPDDWVAPKVPSLALEERLDQIVFETSMLLGRQSIHALS